jgi:anti-anti-sigma regulatory factor
MLAIAPGWGLEVERGPGCLLVKLGTPGPDAADAPPLADELWSLMKRHLVSRLILDLKGIRYLDRQLLAQLLRLQRRIREHGGMVRLTGLSADNRALVVTHRLNGRLPVYNDFEDAVMGPSSRKPR